MKPHIVIIGMPWSGKSTTAHALAEKLSMDFVDLDKEVERIEGKNLIDVMNEKGPDYFREMEYNMLLKLATPTVISPAGSIIYFDPAMKWLGEHARVLFLNTPLDTIKSRMQGNPKAVSDLVTEGIDGLFAKRFPLYKNNADYTVDSNGKTTSEIVDEMLSFLNI